MSSHTTNAVTIVEAVTERRFGDIVERFAPGLRALVTAEALAAGWDSATSRLGALTGIGAAIEDPAATGAVLVKVPVTFTGGGITVLVSMAAGGDLSGIQLAPLTAMAPTAAWQPPSYVDTSDFDEHEVTLGAGASAVSGTVSMPHGDTPRPAVVLLAGSGPCDRDTTYGPNKPLKDVAWGLAGRGIGVLRFDKVTHAHPAEAMANPAFTVLDEYGPATRAAIAVLRTTQGIDPRRIVLLGHSLGGTVAPRIAAEDPGLAGLVLFAAGAQPMHWSTVRQVRYIAGLDPAGAAQAAPAIATLTEQARRVDDPGLTARTPADQLPFGLPAPYWLDLRDHDPVGIAAALRMPMLVVNGGRDYQATIADDLALWRTGLRGRDDVTIREYPADNHFFFPGDRPATPPEYQEPGHVDETVVRDIAEWIQTLGAPG